MMLTLGLCLPVVAVLLSSIISSKLQSGFRMAAQCAILAALLFSCGEVAFAQTAHFVGVYSTLAATAGGPSDVAVDRNGNVYLAEYDGGTIDEIVAVNGNISAFSPMRILTKCVVDCWSVAVDSSGNVYFIDYETVNEMLAVNGSIPASPVIKTITTKAPYPSGLAVDGSGDVYVADDYDGTVNEVLAVNGTIPASPTIRLLTSGLSEPVHLALDNSGNLYVSADSLVEILAVNGSIPTSPTVVALPGGAPGEGRGVAVDSSGDVYSVGYNQTNEILAVNGSIPASPLVRVVTGSSNGYGFDGVGLDTKGNVFIGVIATEHLLELSTTKANFGSVNLGTTSSAVPLTFAFDTAGTLGSTTVLTQGTTSSDFADAGTGTCTASTAYTVAQTCIMNVTFTPRFSGTSYGAVQLKDGNGNVIATANLQGTGVGPQINFLHGSQNILGTGFSQPWGVAVDRNGDVFVADTSDHQVKEILAVNGSIPTSPTINVLGSGFGAPAGMALDGSGNLYVADFDNNAVYEILSAGGYTAVNSLGGGFANPSGVAVDGSGNVFVADYDNNAIKEVPPGCMESACVETLGSGFNRPFSLAVDGSGNIFVADTNNFTVKEILAGTGYATINALYSQTPFFASLAVDGAGDVFVSDTDNNRILELPVSDGYTTASILPGNFNLPYGLAISGAGNLYVADTGNSQILVEDFADPPSLTFASTAYGSTSTDSPQTVSVENVGNAALTFPIPSAGNNPSIAANFTLASDSGSDCPLLSGQSSAPGTLAAGASCQLLIGFAPTAAGALSGSLILTDNNLNAAAPNYTTQTIQLSGTGIAATPTIAWTAPSAIIYGTPLSAAQLRATANVPGTFSYSPAVGTVLGAGSQTLTVTFTPTDTTDYTQATATVSLTVNEVTPVITWNTPAAITYGTALSPAQLNASSTVAGAFVYSPTLGTVLTVGPHTLSTAFTPTDTVDYTTATATVTLTVNQPAPGITSALTAGGTIGSAFSYQITASNSPTSYAVTGLPSGLSVNTSTGLISGTPASAGTSSITLSATNSTGTGTATLTLTINPSAAVGISFVQATAKIAPGTASSLSLAFSANTLPGDLILVAFDFVSGNTPLAVTDSQGNTFIAVGSQLTTPGGAGSRVYYSQNIKGGADTVTVKLTGSSSWLEAYLTEYAGAATANVLDVQTGASGSTSNVSSGTATTTTAGDRIFGYCVADWACTAGSGFAARSTFDGNLIEDMTAATAGSYAATGTATNGWTMQMIALKPASATTTQPPAITSALTETSTAGSAFSYQIAASNSPISYSAMGLPSGLSVNTSTGLISGTPTSAGTSSVTLSATNSTGTGTATLTLTIVAPTPGITSALTAGGTVGSAFSYQITASNSPTSYAVTGLPSGLAVNTSTGLISGTPTVAGTFSVTLSATNSTGTGTATLTLTINPIAGTGISFVQATAKIAPGTASSLSLAFSANTLPGDLILVAFDFVSGNTPLAVTDSQGNTFIAVGSQLTTPGGAGSRVYYSQNIKGGADTVTVKLTGSSSWLEAYLTEYAGAATANVLDVQTGASGSTSNVSSGTATTTTAGDRIFGYCVADWACTAGSGFAARSTFDGNLIEDMTAATAGSYAATGTATNGWTMQMIALKP